MVRASSYVTSACVLVLACAPPEGSADAGPLPDTIGGDRPARVIVPASSKGLKAALFLLAGYSYSAADMDAWLGLTRLAEADDVVFVLPDGIENSDGDRFWNATETCCDYEGSGVDDRGYLASLRAELLRKFPVDPRRTFLVGHSNGGILAYRLACDDPGSWSAVAVLAGSLRPDPDDCKPARPVDVLHVHGSFDRLMPYAGDDSGPGAVAVLARWAELNRCESEPTIDPVRREYVDNTQEDETEVHRFACAEPARVEHWKVVRSGHEPKFRPRFTEELVRWLLATRR